MHRMQTAHQCSCLCRNDWLHIIMNEHVVTHKIHTTYVCTYVYTDCRLRGPLYVRMYKEYWDTTAINLYLSQVNKVLIEVAEPGRQRGRS